jgi:GNAT superfamily N-acetyltransferase
MSFRRAVVADLDELMRLQAEFYAEDRYVHRTARAKEAWTALLENGQLGETWVVDAGDQIVGYVVVTYSYSLEFLGRDAFVDELFVTSAFRRKGLGREALGVAERVCRQAGVRALHLEMEHGKPAAAELYRTWGFVDHNRALMTKWLADPSS